MSWLSDWGFEHISAKHSGYLKSGIARLTMAFTTLPSLFGPSDVLKELSDGDQRATRLDVAGTEEPPTGEWLPRAGVTSRVPVVGAN